jgi:hypothetical protein
MRTYYMWFHCYRLRLYSWSDQIAIASLQLVEADHNSDTGFMSSDYSYVYP